MRAWLCAVGVVAACGHGAGTGDDDAPEDAAVDSSDGSVGQTWTSLIERSWQIEPGLEKQKCVRKRVDVDTYISGFRVKSPIGTHHEILTISDGPATPNGSYDCPSGNLDQEMLFAGGIGTNDLMFPAGVVIKVPAGSYITLSLHLHNSSDSYLTGTSGIEVVTLPASEVVYEADMMFLGTFDIHIPPTGQPWKEFGSCTIPENWNVLALWPHMQGYATHQTVKVRRAGAQTDMTVIDADYSFQDQKNYPMQNLALHPNDLFQVECTYVNNTNATYPPGFEVVYGESANVYSEKCFTGFYKWPADGLQKYFCAPPM